MILTRPQLLKPGDTVATLSLSWGGAGTFPHRYEAGKKQLEEVFGLNVIETKNALKSADYIYKNPQARAEDLMEAFSDSSVKAIISNIGGDDSIRTLPFTDLSVIRNNPKIFLGFSDTTVTHVACYKAGLTSFYGTSVLVGFAENGGMHQYQIEDIKRTLFSTEPVGQVLPNHDGWTTERLEWGEPELQNTKRSLVKDSQWNFLQGTGKVKGGLIGGCVDVLEFLKGTDFWFSESDWDGKILFLETSEEMISPLQFCWALRNYAAQGIFNRISGLILGRPYDNKYVQEYNEILLQVIRDEEGRDDLTIVTEMNFGHTCPVFTIPYGVMAEIDNERKTFSILESGVTI
ncbi:LD-carboxypeptidase [Elizabethkingia miricola]|uniref:S66 family peptidase n=1 Tax=Elizabethkingia miricola TaxID=172045 RepID=UPI002013264E|nr:S66 peptidase family protein [Elizabethkingia miricola]MCL1680001.1 LD-carboxypeptidase [Elizabethkingia miricola]